MPSEEESEEDIPAPPVDDITEEVEEFEEVVVERFCMKGEGAASISYESTIPAYE